MAMNKAHSHLMQNPDEKTRTTMGERPSALASPQGVKWVKSTPKSMREEAANLVRAAKAIDDELNYWLNRMKPGCRTDEYPKGKLVWVHALI